MIHIILCVVAGVLGIAAASSGASGFWTGMFVGAVMATSGVTWAKHILAQFRKEQAIKEAQLAQREAVLQKAIERMEALQKQSAVQPAAKPATGHADDVPPPPPPVSKAPASKPEVTPRPGPQPLPDELFSPSMQFPTIHTHGQAFEHPPN